MSGNSDLLIKIGGDTSEWSKSLADMGKELLATVGEINPIAAGVVAAVSAIGIAAVDSAVVFEESYNKIIAVTGATGTELDGLKESFDTVFTTVPGDAEKVAESIGLIYDRLHLTGDALTEFTTQVAQLSLATGTDMVQNADAVTKAFQNWNISTADQGHSLDILNSVAQQNGLTVQALAGSMADIGNLARLSGESFEQTANQIGLMESKGVDGATMFQAIQMAMSRAQKAGDDLSGITMPNLIHAIELGIQSGNGLGVAIDEFGRKGPQIYEMVKDNLVSSADLMNTHFKDATDSVKNTYAATDTFGRQLTILKDNLMAFLEPLGAWIVGGAKDFLKWLNEAVVGVESIYLAMTGQKDALDKLVKSYDDANPRFGDAASKTVDTSKATALLNVGIVDLTNTLGGASAGLRDLTAEHAAHAAAVQYTKDNTQLLKDAVTILDEADKQHAENIKASFTPALVDLATAQANVTQYQQAAAQADNYLIQTETDLQKLINSHTATNQQLKDAEDAVTLAKASSKVANENLSESQKTLTASKADDATITNLLKTATQAIAEAIRTDHIPATMSLVDAEQAVVAAKQATQDAIQKEQTAIQALSDFQHSTGERDAATEKQLKDDITTATTNLTTARANETQALKDQATVKQAGQALDNDILANQKLLDSFIKDTQIGTFTSLGEALQNINDLKQKQIDSATALQAVLNTENDLAKSGQVDTQAYADALVASKQAKDDYKTATDAVNTAEALAAKNYGLSKDQILLMTPALKDAASQAAVTQAAYNTLGIQSTDALQAFATAADAAYAQVLASGTTSADTLLKAQIADLTAQANAIKATGDGSVPAAMQIQLAALKTKQGDFITDSQTQWSTLYTNIDGAVKGFASSAINTLFTGQGSFKEEGLAALESIGESVVTTFTKKATDAVAGFISGAITDLLSGKGLGGVLDSLTKIGSSVSGIFSSASGVVDSAGDSAAGAGGAITDIASAGGDAAGAGGSAASAVGSTLSTVTSVFSMVTGAISAVTGILSLFGVGQGGQKDRLNGIDNATTYLAWAYDAGGVKNAILDSNNVLHYYLDTSFNGWYKSWLDDTSHLLYEGNDRQKDIAQHLSSLDFALSFNDGIVPVALDKIATLVNQPPVVNVAVAIDGNAIAAVVTTKVEQQIKNAGGA